MRPLTRKLANLTAAASGLIITAAAHAAAPAPSAATMHDGPPPPGAEQPWHHHHEHHHWRHHHRHMHGRFCDHGERMGPEGDNWRPRPQGDGQPGPRWHHGTEGADEGRDGPPAHGPDGPPST